MLRADHATIEWNEEKKRWEVHVKVGAEVIKRPIPKASRQYTAADTTEVDAMKNEAITIAKDEGYDLNPTQVTVVH